MKRIMRSAPSWQAAVAALPLGVDACGGDAMGQMTLSRAFAVHVAILPALTFFFIVAHLVAFRQFGSVGPWKSKKPA